jgi:hypothetical protein
MHAYRAVVVADKSTCSSHPNPACHRCADGFKNAQVGTAHWVPLGVSSSTNACAMALFVSLPKLHLRCCLGMSSLLAHCCIGYIDASRQGVACRPRK